MPIARKYAHLAHLNSAEYRREAGVLRQRDQRVRNPELQRNSRLKYCFGINIAEYEAMREAQGGVCAICKRPPGKKDLAVDHCHKTGQIRALLCAQCNTGIGMFSDDPEVLEAAAEYVRRFADADLLHAYQASAAGTAGSSDAH